jgi:hypothetical protein
MGHLQIFSLRSSRPVLSAISGLGLAGTRRRGGAGGIGACWSLGPWRTKPPGPIERICGCGGEATAAGATDGAAVGWVARGGSGFAVGFGSGADGGALASAGDLSGVLERARARSV